MCAQVCETEGWIFKQQQKTSVHWTFPFSYQYQNSHFSPLKVINCKLSQKHCVL